MATKTVVCPECGEPAPYGRLTCPACGTLLAVVAGGARTAPLASVPYSELPTLVDDGPEPPPPPQTVDRRRGRSEPTVARDPAVAAVDEDAPLESGRAVTVAAPADAPSDDPAPDVAAAAVEPAPATAASAVPEPDPATPEPVPAVATEEPDPAPKPLATPPSTPAYAPTPAARARLRPSTPPMLDDWPADRPLTDAEGPRPFETEEEWDGRRGFDVDPGDLPPAVALPADPPRPAPTSAAPGAYLPPSASFVMGVGGGAAVAGGAAYGHATAAPMRTAQASSAGAAQATESPPNLKAGSASLLADLPFDAPDTLAGWLVAVGAAGATISFLLPWANLLYGARGVSGYMGEWGLANGANLLVFLGTAIVLALATVPNRVPAWLRGGVVPMAVGGLVLGLAWPYVFSSFGRFGLIVASTAAILMIIGGALALRPRHGRGGTAV